MITGISYCTAVANSCPFIRKSPSPAKRDHDPIWKLSLCQNSGRRPITHGSASRSKLGTEFAEAIVAMNPDSEITGAITNNRVSGQAVAQPSDYLAVLKGAWKLSWCFRPIQIFRMSRGSIGSDE